MLALGWAIVRDAGPTLAQHWISCQLYIIRRVKGPVTTTAS